MPEPLTGWLPDFLYADRKIQSGIALFVTADGTISHVSADPEELKRARRLSARVLLPGLINVHSHAFQRVIRARTEHRTTASLDNFWTWREAMYHAADRLSPEDVYTASCMAFLEMLASGITTVGEFHYLHHSPDGTRYADPALLSREVLRAAQDTGIRIVLLEAAYARAGFQKPSNSRQARFIFGSSDEYLSHVDRVRSLAPPETRVGVAPHSIRAVPLPEILEIARYARTHRLPLHMHVAEQPAEIEACLAEYGLTPVALLAEHELLDPSFTAVHATHLKPDEISTIAAARANICACPTTERNLGDGIAPVNRWQASRVNVCLGSDSNIQIDLLEDARELEYHLRLQRLERAILNAGTEIDSLAGPLFQYASRNGAASLGIPAGELRPGQFADFFTLDLSDLSLAGADQKSLLSHIVFATQRSAIRDVFVAGRPVIEDRQHASRQAIVEPFSKLQQRLWR